MRLLRQMLLGAIFLGLVIGGVFYYPHYAKSSTYILVLNSDITDTLPRMFRMTQLKTSGSAQFTDKSLKKMLQVIPNKRVIIFDLREEPHGFLNGNAVSWYKENNWYNEGKSREEIIASEKEFLEALSKEFVSIVYKSRQYPVPYLVRNVASEKELVEKYGAEYYRLPIRDHVRPSDEFVDEFVAFVKNLDGDVWLHFHCLAGKGRTTTFLGMYDIIKNASNSTLEEIVERQQFYGGINLFNEPDEDEWKHSYILERIAFIRKFYQYAKENPDFSVSWSGWVRAGT